MVSALSNVVLQTENSMHRNACYNNNNNTWTYKNAHRTFVSHEWIDFSGQSVTTWTTLSLSHGEVEMVD